MIGGEEGEVGGGEGVGGEIGPGGPDDVGVFEGLGRWGVGGEAADEGGHEDGDPGVGVEDVGEGFEDFDLAAEFFLEFAVEGGGGGLAGVDFTAGEFPEAGEVFAGGAAGDEELGLGGVPDEGADDGGGGHLDCGLRIGDWGLGIAEGGDGRFGRLDFFGDFWWN